MPGTNLTREEARDRAELLDVDSYDVHLDLTTSPTTFRGWTGWSTANQGFMLSPYSPYGIRFHVEVRCVGSNATSGSVGSTSGYVY